MRIRDLDIDSPRRWPDLERTNLLEPHATTPAAVPPAAEGRPHVHNFGRLAVRIRVSIKLVVVVELGDGRASKLIAIEVLLEARAPKQRFARHLLAAPAQYLRQLRWLQLEAPNEHVAGPRFPKRWRIGSQGFQIANGFLAGLGFGEWWGQEL